MFCINICKVPRELFLNSPRSPGNVNAMKIHVRSLLLHKFNHNDTNITKMCEHFFTALSPLLHGFLHALCISIKKSTLQGMVSYGRDFCRAFISILQAKVSFSFSFFSKI